jgi:hypothetical protein
MLMTSSRALAAPGDTTWVRTFDHDFYNWATPHVDTFPFPDTTVRYSDILLRYRIGCPGAPADCDPWDRIGYLQVLSPTGEADSLGQPILEPYEIARIITPYDITGGTRPDSCSWEFDVTPYMSILHDTVILSNYIESWIGGDQGWIVTIDFGFVEGEADHVPYKVMNLWQSYYTLFGDPDVPIEDVLVPMVVEIDTGITGAGLRVITTGHGQGNTGNCAEFCPKEHTIIVNGNVYSHELWRDDCSQNPCHPQGGTWQYARAGWCPGSSVIAWDVNITSALVPGDSATLDYDVEPYENLCRPTNPDCVNGVTCTDCEYNYTGHTPPHYSIQAQLVFYRKAGPVGIGGGEAPGGSGTLPVAFDLLQNYPNPFNPSTTISFILPENDRGRDRVYLAVYSVRGRLVRTLVDRELETGRHEIVWDGRDNRGEQAPSGVYISSLRTGTRTAARKLLLCR